MVPFDDAEAAEQRRAREEALIAERNAAQREAQGGEQPLILRGEGDAAAAPTTESVPPPDSEDADLGRTGELDEAAEERDAEWGTAG